MAVANIVKKKQKTLFIGNLDAKRDWGYAKEYVEGMWLMLQAPKPDDYVLATGITTTVRDFITMAFEAVGIAVDWTGPKGSLDEIGINRQTGDVLVRVDPRYFRPTEVDLLIGDPAKAKAKLGWEAKTSVKELVTLMVKADLEKVSHCVEHG
jgi:GDPmannose 4,6-dehydratase